MNAFQDGMTPLDLAVARRNDAVAALLREVRGCRTTFQLHPRNTDTPPGLKPKRGALKRIQTLNQTAAEKAERHKEQAAWDEDPELLANAFIEAAQENRVGEVKRLITLGANIHGANEVSSGVGFEGEMCFRVRVRSVVERGEVSRVE